MLHDGQKDRSIGVNFLLSYRCTSIHLSYGLAYDRYRNAVPMLPDLYLIHFVLRLFPSIDILLGPINVAFCVCNLETKVSIRSKTV